MKITVLLFNTRNNMLDAKVRGKRNCQNTTEIKRNWIRQVITAFIKIAALSRISREIIEGPTHEYAIVLDFKLRPYYLVIHEYLQQVMG